MADAIDRMLRSLEDRFEADLGTEERVAASDLALSLLQDQSLREVAPRGCGLTAEGRDGRFEVGMVGTDFVADRAGSVFLRLANVVLIEGAHEGAPEDFDGSLLDALRVRSRQRPRLRILLEDGELRGALVRVGRDHLVIADRRGRVFVPGGAIRSIRCVRGD